MPAEAKAANQIRIRMVIGGFVLLAEKQLGIDCTFCQQIGSRRKLGQHPLRDGELLAIRDVSLSSLRCGAAAREQLSLFSRNNNIFAAQSFKQSRKFSFKLPRLLPIGKIGDVILAELNGEIFATVCIKTLPIAKPVKTDESHRKKFTFAASFFLFEGFSKLGHHPLAL
jgi:hypothetical protein